MATEKLSGLISALKTDSSSGGSGKENAIGREPGTGDLTNCLFYAAASSSSTAYLEYSFDLSGIPAGAEIDSVVCVAGGYTSTPSYYSTYSAQLYSGSTAKGNSGNLLVTTTSNVVTFDGGAWTQEELNDCRIRFYAKKKSYGTMKQCYVTGAKITVTYTYQSEKFMLKLGGAWHDIARVFKKVNGIWVEQTELANVVDQTKRLVNGGEIESTGPTLISFTYNGTSYQAEEGMTWAEWIASSYNSGFENNSTYITTPDNYVFAYSDGSYVLPSDTIRSGYAYISTR